MNLFYVAWEYSVPCPWISVFTNTFITSQSEVQIAVTPYNNSCLVTCSGTRNENCHSFWYAASTQRSFLHLTQPFPQNDVGNLVTLCCCFSCWGYIRLNEKWQDNCDEWEGIQEDVFMVYFELWTHYLSKWLQKIVKLVRIASSPLEYEMDIVWPHIRSINIAVYYKRGERNETDMKNRRGKWEVILKVWKIKVVEVSEKKR